MSSFGVVPSEMALDPDLDLSDDTASGLPGEEDKNDIIYIAGGHLGLWAMEAHPGANHKNIAVRIDDSGNQKSATQESQRFCTSVTTTTVDGVEYVLALFAKKERNLLRAYRLDELRSIVDAARVASGTPPETGNETTGVLSHYFKAHPDKVPGVTNSELENITFTSSYAINFDVDESLDLPSGSFSPGAVDVYIAALSGGLLRVRL